VDYWSGNLLLGTLSSVERSVETGTVRVYCYCRLIEQQYTAAAVIILLLTDTDTASLWWYIHK
jgi:hypothetical protein